MVTKSNVNTQHGLLSLFTGYGGLEMGVSQVLSDIPTVATSDIDDGACLIEAFHNANNSIPNIGDITQVNMRLLPNVEVIVGGSPCQSVSDAGTHSGMSKHTRSGLWSYMREAIAVKQPSLVVWENVVAVISAIAASKEDQKQWLLRQRLLNEHGLCSCMQPLVDCSSAGLRTPVSDCNNSSYSRMLLESNQGLEHVLRGLCCLRCKGLIFEDTHSGLLTGVKRLKGLYTHPRLRALGRVLGDLATMGYDAIWLTVEAADVGAPHHRARLFVCAWPRNTRNCKPDNPLLQRLNEAPPIQPVTETKARWNTSRDCWETEQTDLFADVNVFEQSWPKQGILADNKIYQLSESFAYKHSVRQQELLYTPKASDSLFDSPSASCRPIEASTFLSTQVRLLDIPGKMSHSERNIRNSKRLNKILSTSNRAKHDKSTNLSLVREITDTAPTTLRIIQPSKQPKDNTQASHHSNPLRINQHLPVKTRQTVNFNQYTPAIRQWEQRLQRTAPCPTQITNRLKNWVVQAPEQCSNRRWLVQHAPKRYGPATVDQIERDRVFSQWQHNDTGYDLLNHQWDTINQKDSILPSTVLPPRCVLDYWRENSQRKQLPALTHLSPKFVEWMMGLPEGWVTDPRIWEQHPGNHRSMQLKALGNGVVPQQAATALHTCLTLRHHLSTTQQP
ncbi:DNA cytosine methyltransferase [Bombiscardovia coagulans]|uniref:DNA (cytosine-5-)-methyltransferase n=1 Tax=Bombiscardovia coagulans TaxID=686666 RepID=A0A261EVF8_9BIFI|nr:DNA cytosine methyltransferase [Bombiscardovia coagulans]OZG50842.1 DNA methyltransferase [Bombiscardovia coagulans]